jgi:hypothetical protein
MAVVGSEVRRGVSLPLGIQVLAGANLWAIAVAHACSASFVRVEGFVFAHVADEGLIESTAGSLLRYRRTNWFGYHAGEHRELFVSSRVYRWFISQTGWPVGKSP